jgi:hypothetical protein
MLDGTILNTAMPAMAKDLLPLAHAAAVIAYMLTTALLIPACAGMRESSLAVTPALQPSFL